MATVPGNPYDEDEFYGGIHPSLRPTQADLLLAAGIMHQNGHPAFAPAEGAPPVSRVAMDTSQFGRPSTNVEDVRSRGPAEAPPALNLMIDDPMSQRLLPKELRKPRFPAPPGTLDPGEFPDVG